MAKNRDIVQEIADIRQRRQYGDAMSELPMRLLSLRAAFEKHDPLQEELSRYFPVALIACIEGYVRLAVKDLIDSGEPYFGNAEKLAPAKLDFATLRAIHGKAITVGELIAHSISVSRLEHIDGVFSSLLGRSFLQGLRTVSDRWAHEVRGESLTPILADPEWVFGKVERAFELRHIICHEIASAHEWYWEEIRDCFAACVAFLRAADELVSETLYPGSPLTQTEMNIAAGEELIAKRTELTEVFASVKQQFPESFHDLYDEAQEKWQEYATAWGMCVAGKREDGGTIWPIVYAGAEKDAIDRRIEQLREFRPVWGKV